MLAYKILDKCFSWLSKKFPEVMILLIVKVVLPMGFLIGWLLTDKTKPEQNVLGWELISDDLRACGAGDGAETKM